MTDAPVATDFSLVVEFFHSLLRWGVLIAVALAGAAALRGYLRRSPIMTWERALSIWAMVLCHVQLVVGLLLYSMRFSSFEVRPSDEMRYWKYEHVSMMIIAIALVTIGRISSKRATTELAKQKRVAFYYLLALALLLWAIPWPFTQMGEGRGWF